MFNADSAVTCHWLTPTRLMPRPHSLAAGARPWTCLRSGSPRPLDMNELEQCAACSRWEARTFDDTRRDLVFETWGVGIPASSPKTYDEARRDIVLEAWGV
jgi:hypothetical protein